MTLADKAKTISSNNAIIAENEQKVFDAGHTEGYTEGETAGYSNGYDVGVIDGKQAEYDAFWNLKQPLKGSLQAYTGDFGGRWTVDTFIPKYDIVISSAPYLFTGNNLRIDLVEHFEKIGKRLDFSQCGNQNSCFFMSQFTHLGNVSALGGYYNVFQDCKYLVTIDEWGDAQGREMSAAGLTSAFSNCTALENITIKGKFANTVYFHWSTKLTRESIESIINALSDNVSGKTLQLSRTAVDEAFKGGVSAADPSTTTEFGSSTVAWFDLTMTKQNWTITLV